MPDLNGSKTQDNLKEAFAGESQANRRYLYFAQKADVEGYPDVAALFRSVAEGETGHAFGHFDFLAEVGDPVTGEKSNRALTEPESTWSFYRLLLRGRQPEPRVSRWEVGEPVPGTAPAVVRFDWKEDPWDLFTVPEAAR